MQAPGLPDNEVFRLRALHALHLLDTDAEERFDRLVRIARKLFAVEAAVVSFVDAERQWFKAHCGIELSETPREVSFCGHAILHDDVFVVPDASADIRFADNPLVIGEPHIRFYAGCPLQTRDGCNVGTLCLFDGQARQFDDDDMALLRDLASMAQQELTAIQLATSDELTGISNRQGFLTLSRHTLNLCRRQGNSAALIYLDLDNFERIEASHGTAAADQALAAFAELLASCFRESDLFARLARDDFVVLVTNQGAGTVEVMLERFDALLADHNRTAHLGYDIGCTVGTVEVVPGDDEDIETLLVRAEGAMRSRREARRRARSSGS